MMPLRTARFRSVLKCPARCNSLTQCLPVYVPTVAGRSYASKYTENIRPTYRDRREHAGSLSFMRDRKENTVPYTLSDVPAPTDLEALLRHPAAPAYLKGMTAAQAHGVLTEYAQGRLEQLEAVRTRPKGLITDYKKRVESHNADAVPWPWVLRRLLRDDPANKPAVLATLHCLACVLLFTPGGRKWVLPMHILRDLSREEAYAPSELTLVRLALVTASVDLERSSFASYVKRVTTGRILLDTDNDRANYETLRGLLCLAGAKTEKAARDALWWFQQALDPQKGRRTPGAFDWQATCMVEMGRCYQRLGEAKKAVQLWELAARELDHPEAASLFATAGLDKRDPRAEEWLTRAAMAGQRDAQVGLARIQKAKWDDTKAKGVKGWEFAFQRVMKDEWAALSQNMP